MNKNIVIMLAGSCISSGPSLAWPAISTGRAPALHGD